MLESAVDDNVVKFHAFAGKSLENLVVWLPKSILGKRFGAQSVLVGHHHEFKIESIGNEVHVAEHTGDKFEFLERIELVVDWRLHDQSAVAVDKQSLASRRVIFHIV